MRPTDPWSEIAIQFEAISLLAPDVRAQPLALSRDRGNRRAAGPQDRIAGRSIAPMCPRLALRLGFAPAGGASPSGRARMPVRTQPHIASLPFSSSSLALEKAADANAGR